MREIDLSEVIDTSMASSFEGFPIEIFPKPIQNLIQDAKYTVGYNPDYFSAGILSLAATAIGNTMSLDNGSYIVKPILWVAIIGRPGTGKTHPLQFAKNPIEKKDNQSYKEFEEAIEEYENAPKESKRKKPTYSKFILKDFTPEKLAESLQYNDKGILIFQDELMRWINSFDQYKKGGDQQMYLDLFNGNGLTVDRVTKDPIRIEETNVNILGGMQPEILKGLANNNRNQDGFLDRFLFVYPDNLKPDLFTGKKISSNCEDNYKRIVSNLLNAPSQVIEATENCIRIFMDWQHTKAEECFKDQLEYKIQKKLETYVWRLALIIEVIDQSTTGNYSTILNECSLEKAINLIEYFRSNALKVHDQLLSRDPLANLTKQQLDLYIKLPGQFKRQEVLPLFDSLGFKGGSIGRFLNRKESFSRLDSKGNYKKKL